MASKSILRTSIRSPRAFMTPRSSKSILKRPAPLPLSPGAPAPFAASFSVLVSPNKLSPHVHFTGSPAMVATFSALSPASFDRAPISASPASASWADRVVSPAGNTFKLGNPPKRTPTVAKNNTLTVPSFEDPRSPKPYISRNPAPKETSRDTPTVATLTVPSFGDPRSPKPYVARSSAQKETLTSTKKDALAPPTPFVDPRSPKPYIPRSGVRFEEIVLHVPRGPHGMENLGKALTVYPRSPYPSAPLADEEVDSTMEDLINSPRGRTMMRSPKPTKRPTHSRARSLSDIQSSNSKRRPAPAAAFLSPVKESPNVMMKTPATRPAPLPLPAEISEAQLSTAFWQAMTLEETPVSSGLNSPALMFGNQDGTLWSPRPRKKEFRGMGETMVSMMSPAQRNVFRKGDVASPSPNDPFAAFPSFTIALMNMEGVISYPPRARVE